MVLASFTVERSSSGKSAELRWKRISGCDSYAIRRDDVQIHLRSGTASSWTDTGLDPTRDYTYAVWGIARSPSLVSDAVEEPAPPPPPPPPPPSAGQGEILIRRADLMARPTSGAAWSAMNAAASAFTAVNLGVQEDPNDVRLLAKALVTVRTGASLSAVHTALGKVPGTEGASTLALGRQLLSVVLAADLTGYRPSSFVSWLAALRTKTIDGRTLISTHEDRPNNWGTHAGASRIAADLYLGDAVDLAKAIQVYKGWLGDRSAYSGFIYNQAGWEDWQADPSKPVGVNPKGATRQGHSIDGVLPDDLRRAETGFVWPPPRENYVWEALQGALMQAELLHRQGHLSYAWSDGALGRAYAWLHTPHFAGGTAFPAEGDDEWQPHLVNVRYGASYPTKTPAQFGKNFGFTDWLYG